jgi:predicted nucleic acid-binding protein
MIVISDTSPLCYLVVIGEISLLPELFGQVSIPPAVVDELRDAAAPNEVVRWISDPPNLLQIATPESIDFSLDLGPGEMEAIALARQFATSILLIDERRGTQTARKLGLKTTGTLGLLQLASSKGQLNLAECIARLRSTNFRCSDAIYSQILSQSS